MTFEIIVSNSTKTKDIQEIDKAIQKLKLQENKLVDLYLNSSLNVETINNKNDSIKKEIENLNKKKQKIDPDNVLKEYVIELSNKLEGTTNSENIINNKDLYGFVFEHLNRKSKKDLIKKIIESIEILRDEKYNIEIKNIRFTEEFISKNSKEYIKYLNDILQNNSIGYIYKEPITKQELEKLKEDYHVFYHSKLENKEYSAQETNEYLELLQENFYTKGVINCPIIEDKIVVEHVDLIQKSEEKLLQNTRIKINEFWKMQILCPSKHCICAPAQIQIWDLHPIPQKIKIERNKKVMNDEKVNYVIDMIKDMDMENKLRLAICMCDNYSHTNLKYDKKEMYKYFDNLLKEINIEYRTTTINFANYPYIIFASSKIMEMDSTEQNKVALYLFNSINFKIKNYKSIDNAEQMF